MEPRSILVNVDVVAPDSPALRYAIDLAEKFDAELIGVAAAQPDLTFAGTDGGAAFNLYAIEQSEIETQLRRAEEVFNAVVPATVKKQWRAFVANATSAVIETATLADLIVSGAKAASTFQDVQATNLGQIVLAAGRPVIDVARDATSARLDKICIGWKDTREARHAVADALPLLKLAKEVTAVTISEGDYAIEKASLDDLIAWLKVHDVAAQDEMITNPEGFVDVLESTSLGRKADLLVTGGYGHSRMREWLFGGMTRRILQTNELNRFISN